MSRIFENVKFVTHVCTYLNNYLIALMQLLIFWKTLQAEKFNKYILVNLIAKIYLKGLTLLILFAIFS